jgi:hypothetical protein
MLIKFLKYINSIPFNFTIKHYQMFGDSRLKNNSLNFMESWDTLRSSNPHFSIPETREEWLSASEAKVVKDGQDKGLVSRAKDISVLFANKKINSVFSAGVGGAGLEYQIKKNLPGIKMVCSEYSPQNVSMLKKVFTECDDVILFDILKGDWNFVKENYLKDANSVLIIYRLDAGFTNEEWRKIFESIHNAGIKNVLYIPTGLLTLLSIWNRKKREIKWAMTRKPVSFAGHLRSKKKFQSFWRGLYGEEGLNPGGLQGFFLERI